MHDPELESLRALIDSIDEELVAILARRAATAVRIGEAKRALGAKVCDRERESAVIQRVLSANSGPVSNEDLQAIYEAIIAACSHVQQSS